MENKKLKFHETWKTQTNFKKIKFFIKIEALEENQNNTIVKHTFTELFMYLDVLKQTDLI